MEQSNEKQRHSHEGVTAAEELMLNPQNDAPSASESDEQTDEPSMMFDFPDVTPRK